MLHNRWWGTGCVEQSRGKNPYQRPPIAHTVPLGKLIFRGIKRNLAGKTKYRYYACSTYLVFLYISCYISEIWLTFWTVQA